jgi:hypothetical protein
MCGGSLLRQSEIAARASNLDTLTRNGVRLQKNLVNEPLSLGRSRWAAIDLVKRAFQTTTAGKHSNPATIEA